jgi:hypothetical protein
MADDKSATGVRWLAGPEDHDYPAAASYLSLLASPAGVDALVAALKAAKLVRFKGQGHPARGRPLLARRRRTSPLTSEDQMGKALSLLSTLCAKVWQGWRCGSPTATTGCASYHCRRTLTSYQVAARP